MYSLFKLFSINYKLHIVKITAYFFSIAYPIVILLDLIKALCDSFHLVLLSVCAPILLTEHVCNGSVDFEFAKARKCLAFLL